MNTVAFIPARSQSKGVKDKNIREINGKHLIGYSIETALACNLRTIVSSDSESYLQIARSYGAEGLLRNPKLSKDNTSMFEVLKSEIPKTGAETVVLLQPTSPFRKKLHIKLALTYLKNYPDYDSVVVVERVPEKYNPYAYFIQTPEGNKVLFRKLIGLKEKIKSWFTGKKYQVGEFPIGQRVTRRQDVTAWIPTGELYAFRSKNLTGDSFYGDKVMLIESEGSLNLNTEEDFVRATNYLKNGDNS